MKARGIALAALTGAAIALGGCADQQPAEPGGITVEVPEADDERDRWDCEDVPGDEERERKEQPDCGRYVNGRWVEWSWVKAGRTTPPAGWSVTRELGTAKPAPAGTRSSNTRTTAPKPERSTAKAAGGKTSTRSK